MGSPAGTGYSAWCPHGLGQSLVPPEPRRGRAERPWAAYQLQPGPQGPADCSWAALKGPSVCRQGPRTQGRKGPVIRTPEGLSPAAAGPPPAGTLLPLRSQQGFNEREAGRELISFSLSLCLDILPQGPVFPRHYSLSQPTPPLPRRALSPGEGDPLGEEGVVSVRSAPAAGMALGQQGWALGSHRH